jgi:hypothetical protein
MISFVDSQKRSNTTGDVGLGAHEVFLGVQEAIKNSLIVQQHLNNTKAICIRVSKKEPKRIDLYKRIIARTLSHIFPYSYVDESTENDRGMNVLIFTREKLQ